MKKSLKMAVPVVTVCLLAAILSVAPIRAQDASDGVTLTESQVAWLTIL